MCTLYGNVDYLLYEKLVGQPKLIYISMCGEIFVFFQYYDWIICCEHLEFVLNPMASRDYKLNIVFSSQQWTITL